MEVLQTKTEGTACITTLKIEAPEFERALEDAYLDNTDRIVVPGYAPGLAPRSEIERLYGAETLWDEALDRLIPQLYRRYLDEEQVRILGKPKVEEISRTRDGGFAFRVRAEGYPRVTLGEYKGLAVPLAREADEEAFRTAVLQAACANMAGEVSPAMTELKLAAMAAQEKIKVSRDSVYHLLADTVAILDKAYRETGITRPMAQVRGEAMDIMLATVTGSNTDPSQDFLKDQVSHLAAQYRPLPEDFDGTLDKIIRKRAQKKAEMTPEEAADDIFAAYLGSIDLTEAQWRAERQEEAEASARCDLLLDAVARAEGLTLTDDEIDGMILKIAESCDAQPEAVAEAMDMDALKGQLLREKACALLVDSAAGGADDGR